MPHFLQLPDDSPAEPLMLALVHLGDALAEHGHLLPKETSSRLFAEVCSTCELVLSAHGRSKAETKLALANAASL